METLMKWIIIGMVFSFIVEILNTYYEHTLGIGIITYLLWIIIYMLNVLPEKIRSAN